MDYGPGKLDSALLLDYGVLDWANPQVAGWAGCRLHAQAVSAGSCSVLCHVAPRSSRALKQHHHTQSHAPSTPQGGYTLTLTLPESDRYFDDKADILERAGLGTSASFSIMRGQEPPREMMGFLRLMQLQGACVCGVGGWGGEGGACCVCWGRGGGGGGWGAVSGGVRVHGVCC
jgi:hypothetical protein